MAGSRFGGYFAMFWDLFVPCRSPPREDASKRRRQEHRSRRARERREGATMDDAAIRAAAIEKRRKKKWMLFVRRSVDEGMRGGGRGERQERGTRAEKRGSVPIYSEALRRRSAGGGAAWRAR